MLTAPSIFFFVSQPFSQKPLCAEASGTFISKKCLHFSTSLFFATSTDTNIVVRHIFFCEFSPFFCRDLNQKSLSKNIKALSLFLW